MKRAIRYTLIATAILTSLPFPATAFQRGATRTSDPKEYGVNLTFAVYQFDEKKTGGLEEFKRFSATFQTAQDELNYLKNVLKLEDVMLRYYRSVGLTTGDSHTDIQMLGSQEMAVTVIAREVIRGSARFEISARYGNKTVLEPKSLQTSNFETVGLKGSRAPFGQRTFIGPGGKQETVETETALYMTITTEIVLEQNLRNRPGDLARPVDQFGVPLRLSESDKFTVPVVLERVVPNLVSSRPLLNTVLLEGIVTPEGNVINVRVVRSIDPAIDERAIDAFRRYRFKPATLNGKPIYSTFREEIAFRSPGQ